MSDLGKRLGRRIYEFWKQGKLTQAALAEKAKISNEFMSAVERGAKLPSLPVLERIANGLKVEMKDLVNFDRASYRRAQSLSREIMDLAFQIEGLKGSQRYKMLKMAKILASGES